MRVGTAGRNALPDPRLFESDSVRHARGEPHADAQRVADNDSPRRDERSQRIADTKPTYSHADPGKCDPDLRPIGTRP